jgi:lipopolysaccharide export system permease protein
LKHRLGRLFFVHVLREIVVAFGAVSIVLLLLLVTNQIASVLRRAAEGEIPTSVVIELARLSVGEYLVVILPVALLLGILLALGRLYHDSELAAAQACGIGRAHLYGPAMLVAGLAAATCAFLAFQAGPEAARRIHEIRSDAIRTAVTRGLESGKFRSLGSGAVLHFREREGDQLRDVFFQRPIRTERAHQRAGTLEIVVAKRATYSISADGSLYTVVLNDGVRHEGVPGLGEWRTLTFAELVVPIPAPEITTSRSRVDILRTSDLVSDPTRENLAELHWRISTVVTTLLVGLLAVPLAQLRPRQGRYARVGWGVLLYAVYANLLIAGRTLLEQGRTPEWLGLWWVHALIAALVLLLLYAPKVVHRARVRLRRPEPAAA